MIIYTDSTETAGDREITTYHITYEPGREFQARVEKWKGPSPMIKLSLRGSDAVRPISHREFHAISARLLPDVEFEGDGA